MSNAAPPAIIEQIAKDILGLETLEDRRSDRLDFHELGVGQLREALQAAYRAGITSRSSAKTRAK